MLQAIEECPPPKLCEELGDLLLQIMLHAQIASEDGQFTIEDVIRGINDKLIHRHPHVFSDVEVKDAAEVRHNWEALKNSERQDNGSLLDSVPRTMPALSYSQSVQRRVASVGFDWEKTEDILDKLAEEVAEIIKAPDKEEKAREFGDLLFVLVNIARRFAHRSRDVPLWSQPAFLQSFHLHGAALPPERRELQRPVLRRAKRPLDRG